LLTHDLRVESWRSCCLGLHLLLFQPIHKNQNTFFFSKEVIAMFVDAFAMRFPLPRGHSSHHRPPTTAGLWDPQTTCTSLSTSGPDATSQSQVDLKVYIGLSLSLSLSLSRKPGPRISTARTLRKGTSFNQRTRLVESSQAEAKLWTEPLAISAETWPSCVRVKPASLGVDGSWSSSALGPESDWLSSCD
jgi:hypothetical protein